MGKVPCRKCSCGRYHDLAALQCSCGEDLDELTAELIETDDLMPEQRGTISEDVPVYVLRCPVCGAVDYTPESDSRERRCPNCNTFRKIKPLPYEPPTSAPAEEGMDTDAAVWTAMRESISQTIGGTETTDTAPQEDEDAEEAAVGWDALLSKSAPKPSPAPAATPRGEITLSALRYGSLCFMVSAADAPYLLGRSARQAAFLAADMRVSNEHCSLLFRDGVWYVRDDNSSNGTAVNGRDIGLNGERRLADGDELKLGHEADSMAFRVTIA